MELVRVSLEPRPAAFFPRQRLWSRADFLDLASCEALLAEVTASPRKPQSLISPQSTAFYDASVRKTRQAFVGKASQARVTRLLMGLRHELSAHFGVPVTACQPPQFLVYGPGDFFLAHVDAHPDQRPPRALTAVVFLNMPDDPLRPYSGGELLLYAFSDACGRPQGYPLQPQAGLLAVFPAELHHEVLPIQSGVRFSIVSWYY